MVIDRSRHQERVEAVIEIIKTVTGEDAVPDTLIDRINNMDFEELGRLVMDIAEKRTLDDK